MSGPAPPSPRRIEGGLRTRNAFRKSSEPGDPLVTVITPVRNGAKHIDQTIRSVLGQTYANIEYMVVDGGSTDGTLDIIRGYDDQLAYWMSEPDDGPNDAVNKGTAIATGDYYLCLCADDYLYCDTAIETLVRQGIEGGNQPLLIAGRARFALDDELLNWIMPISEENMRRNHYGPAIEATLVNTAVYKTILHNPIFKATGDTNFFDTLRERDLFDVKYVDSIATVLRLGGITNIARTEYFRCVEHEISRYISSGEFRLLRLSRAVLAAKLRNALRRVVGERIYYTRFLYGLYLIRKWRSQPKG